MIQLNEYETAPYHIQLSQNLTSHCLLISVFLPVFAWCAHRMVLLIKTKQFYEHIMQKLVKTGKYTEMNKQSDVKFWLDGRKYGTVSYSFSCNWISRYLKVIQLGWKGNINVQFWICPQILPFSQWLPIRLYFTNKIPVTHFSWMVFEFSWFLFFHSFCASARRNILRTTESRWYLCLIYIYL